MKTQFTQNHVALSLMVSRISASSTPSATRRHSFIINDIPKELEVNTNENMLATIFGSLLNTVITHTENCCIRISAKLYGKVALIHLKQSHQPNKTAFNGSIRQVQQLAEKIGGTISINSERSRATTIVFTFVNDLLLAA
ncbi:MAG: ATP-binding protein [Bacteroidota bacterium]|nr:ATP-binding protein [Bacteroidota bacterium]